MRVLIAAGVSRHAITAAVGAGELIRVRKGWVALPEADPMMVEAARRSVVLTCVTQARRLELWTRCDQTPHVAAHVGSGSRNAGGAVVHWTAPVVARAPDQLTDSIENVLALIAECQPFEDAVAAWESAVNKGLIARSAMSRLKLRPRARTVLAAMAPFADSGLETIVRLRFHKLRIDVAAQIWIEGHHVDFLIGDRLVLQVDGGHHVGKQRDEDIEHDRALTLLGYHVMRVSYVQVIEEWPAVQAQVMRAMAQGLHLAVWNRPAHQR
ncbi:endonuclease domain-containing protein [Branchiibius cervicis]|uniref:Endonuclease domain-containing protein n=1 Tax=Branchiibius cervicis TaxID=908252 RepID=A0ABW2ARC1_9MICO